MKKFNFYGGKGISKKTISPILRIGLFIFIMLTIIERFIVSISDWVAIPLLVVAIILIIVGGLKEKDKT